MRTAFDFAPFRRSTVGFDQLFDLLERSTPSQVNEGYPPFDIVHEGEDKYRICVAVAGFAPDEIEITAQQNQLIISGNRTEKDDNRYIHRGIATRSFERRFALGDFVKVQDADLKDGLLSITLVREIPEEMKPHKININSGERGRGELLEQSASSRQSSNENASSQVAA